MLPKEELSWWKAKLVWGRTNLKSAAEISGSHQETEGGVRANSIFYSVSPKVFIRKSGHSFPSKLDRKRKIVRLLN